MVQPFKEATDLDHALRFHSRTRRRSLAGIPEMYRTSQLFGGTVMPIAAIDTDVQFPTRIAPITFKTAVRILDNVGVHRGLIFELGGASIGAALWLEDTKIGFHAGESGLVNGASAIFDNVVELPVGAEFEIVVAVRPGDGRVRMWSNGTELARATASSDTFGALGTWAGGEDGSFAALPAFATPTDVPATSQIAPNGFEVIEPLSVYVGQVPRHFV